MHAQPLGLIIIQINGRRIVLYVKTYRRVPNERGRLLSKSVWLSSRLINGECSVQVGREGGGGGGGIEKVLAESNIKQVII